MPSNFTNLDFKNPKLKEIESVFSGEFKSTLSGPGFDLNEIRDYTIGDDLRHISWKSTAKTNKLQTKDFFAEKEIRVYYLVDISSSMFCGEKYNLMGKTLSYLFKISKPYADKAGGIYFDHEIKYNFDIRETSYISNIMFEALINYSKDIKIENKETDLIKPINLCQKYFKKKGVVFLVTDLINISNWEKVLYELSNKQNIYLFQIVDNLDFNVKSLGYLYLIDPETKRKVVINSDNKKLMSKYNESMKKKQLEIEKKLNQFGVKHFKIDASCFK